MKKLIAKILKKVWPANKLKPGVTFTVEQKIVLLDAIRSVKKSYLKGDVGGSCFKLQEALESYDYFAGNILFKELCHKYHNPDFYLAHGIAVEPHGGLQWHDGCYWWPYDDSETRIMALDILKQAIIDD